MKKLFFIVVIVLLLSCADEYSLLINNESSYNVTFNLTTGYRTENYTLAAGQQFSHNMQKNHSYKINNFEPKNSVALLSYGNIYTFNDIPPPDPIPASIFNTLKKEVILSGNGAISTDPLTIPADKEITTTIIKNDPVFTAKTTDGYPVQVDYIFDENGYKIILR